MKLAQLKLANSVDYGDAVLRGQSNMEMAQFRIDRRKEESKNNSPKAERHNFGMSIFKHVTKDDKTAAIIASEEVIGEYSKYLTSPSLGVMDDENFDSKDQVSLFRSRAQIENCN